MPHFRQALRMQMLFDVPFDRLFPVLTNEEHVDLVYRIEQLLSELSDSQMIVDNHKLASLRNMHTRLKDVRSPFS